MNRRIAISARSERSEETSGCRAASLLLILVVFASASATCHAADDAPRITLVEDRVWSCEFTSAAANLPMRFLVVLPAGATRESAPLSTIYFLHGRGRHERTLLENETTRARLFASSCAVVLPQGRDGWYMDSPAMLGERYAGYVDEVIALAEKHFPVSRSARGRAIGGWSMGGYGAMYTACRRSGDFAAAASIIGLLDFPRPIVREPKQNYEVPPRFGTDPAMWEKLDPCRLMSRLCGTALFAAYADQSVERQMNEAFIAAARAAGFSIETLVLHGGHTFPMVEQGLPPAFSFLERALGASPPNAPRSSWRGSICDKKRMGRDSTDDTEPVATQGTCEDDRKNAKQNPKHLDANLQLVVEAWPNLSAADRARITAIAFGELVPVSSKEIAT